MRLLLDTHALLWWRDDSPLLSDRARAEIASATNQVFVSAASLWEITIKRALGKLRLGDDFEAMLTEERFDPLPISFAHLRVLDGLPPHHRDPFDRMLIAQAMAEDMPIVTRDQNFAAYGARLLW